MQNFFATSTAEKAIEYKMEIIFVVSTIQWSLGKERKDLGHKGVPRLRCCLSE